MPERDSVYRVDVKSWSKGKLGDETSFIVVATTAFNAYQKVKKAHRMLTLPDQKGDGLAGLECTAVVRIMGVDLL